MKFETMIRSIGGLQQEIVMGPHRMVADEPPENGGQDAGPSPFTLLTAALGA
jgi:putative redox protein